MLKTELIATIEKLDETMIGLLQNVKVSQLEVLLSRLQAKEGNTNTTISNPDQDALNLWFSESKSEGYTLSHDLENEIVKNPVAIAYSNGKALAITKHSDELYAVTGWDGYVGRTSEGKIMVSVPERTATKYTIRRYMSERRAIVYWLDRVTGYRSLAPVVHFDAATAWVNA